MSTATMKKKSKNREDREERAEKKEKKAKFKATPFAMGREEFLSDAPSSVTFVCKELGISITMNRMEFSSGTLGFYGFGKHDIEIDGTECKFQGDFKLMGCNSKQAE